MTKRRLAGQHNDGIDDMDFLNDIDPELSEYLNGSRLLKSTDQNKSRKKKASFSIGEHVEIDNKYGTIIYGPYHSDNGEDTYEIECEDGDIVTAEDNGSIEIYVPPVEEKEEDDDLL